MKIIELKRGDYQDHLLEYEYTTKYYYHVSIKKRGEIKISIKKKRFLRKQVKTFQDHLFASYIDNPLVYGIFDRKKLVAVIEGSLETWNNRFRIWNFLVDKKFRGEGYGKALFDHMIDVAKGLNARAIVLECQSCNEPAIRFYFNRGMHFIGLDTMSYTNHDIDKKEVRFELGMRLSDVENIKE